MSGNGTPLNVTTGLLTAPSSHTLTVAVKLLVAMVLLCAGTTVITGPTASSAVTVIEPLSRCVFRPDAVAVATSFTTLVAPCVALGVYATAMRTVAPATSVAVLGVATHPLAPNEPQFALIAYAAVTVPAFLTVNESTRAMRGATVTAPAFGVTSGAIWSPINTSTDTLSTTTALVAGSIIDRTSQMVPRWPLVPTTVIGSVSGCAAVAEAANAALSL